MAPKAHSSIPKHALRVIAATLVAAAMISARDAAQSHAGQERGSFQAAVIARDKQSLIVNHRWVSDPQLLDIQAASLHDLLWWSFSLAPYQVKGPAWMDSDLFDVQATMGAPAAETAQKGSLQKLLARCFDLRYHFDRQPKPVLLLEQDRKGATLTPSTAARASPPDVDSSWTEYTGRNVSMAELAMDLSQGHYFSRPVLDRTGLTGRYDIALQFSAPPGAPPNIAQNHRPSLEAVLRQKLGLRLASGNSQLPTLQIDSARPVETRCVVP